MFLPLQNVGVFSATFSVRSFKLHLVYVLLTHMPISVTWPTFKDTGNSRIMNCSYLAFAFLVGVTVLLKRVFSFFRVGYSSLCLLTGTLCMSSVHSISTVLRSTFGFCRELWIDIAQLVKASVRHTADAGLIPLCSKGFFLPESTFSAHSLACVCTPLCAFACISICAHVIDPVVHVRVQWFMETLRHPACSVGWIAQLCCSWLSHRKSNPNFW